MNPPSDRAANVDMPRSTPTTRWPLLSGAGMIAKFRQTYQPFVSRLKVQLLGRDPTGTSRWRCTRKPPGIPLKRTREPVKLIPENSAKPKLLNQFASEPWKPAIACFFDSAEETFKGLVQPLESRALKTYREGGSLRIALPPLGERFGLIDVCTLDPRFSVRADPLLERGVVELALGFQYCLKRTMLRLGRQETVSKGQIHLPRVVTRRLTR